MKVERERMLRDGLTETQINNVMNGKRLCTQPLINARDAFIARRYYEGFNLSEIGNLLNLSPPTIASSLARQSISQSPRPSTQSWGWTPKHNGLVFRERFWNNVAIGEPDECWEWQGKVSGFGYGQLRIPSRQLTTATHRIALWLHQNKFPRLHVLHSCDNPPCCNPSHLREGTQQENMADRHTRNYDYWYQRLLEGHKQTCVFSQEQVISIEQDKLNGMTYRSIASKYDVTHQAIHLILTGKIKGYRKYLTGTFFT